MIRFFSKKIPIIIFYIFVLTACRKEEFFFIGEEFKSYTLFPIGTYWVYENQSSMFRDTMTVVDTSFRFGHAVESNLYYQKVIIDYNTKYSGKARGLLYMSSGHNNCSSLSFARIFNSEEIDSSQIDNKLILNNRFFCCCDTGTLLYEYNDKFTEVLDTMLIENKLYFDVMVFDWKITNPILLDSHAVMKSYFAKNVGLIKWELYNGDIWEIVDYKINQ